MGRKSGKLVLKRETIRVLASEELHQVGGGIGGPLQISGVLCWVKRQVVSVFAGECSVYTQQGGTCGCPVLPIKPKTQVPAQAYLNMIAVNQSEQFN
ncbi:MAG: hypothetical protein HJJLKODD_01286 [Phycisphaerae bacterium]|nr:hypothetical protein [Phycisphaerae bacterium]